MEDKFFEGADFKDEEFKALIPKYYPEKYKRYIQEETQLLKIKIGNLDRVLEAGVGIGRLIPELAPLTKEFIGIDNADLMLKKSREVAKNFPNVKIINGNLEELGETFPEKFFDSSLCVWNTLGNVKDEISVLKELAKVTKKSIFVTVYLKGTLKERLNWYKTVGVKISKIDKKEETFYSESGLKSKSYSLEDIERLARLSNLKVKSSKILAGVMLWIELN